MSSPSTADLALLILIPHLLDHPFAPSRHALLLFLSSVPNDLSLLPDTAPQLLAALSGRCGGGPVGSRAAAHYASLVGDAFSSFASVEDVARVLALARARVSSPHAPSPPAPSAADEGSGAAPAGASAGEVAAGAVAARVRAGEALYYDDDGGGGGGGGGDAPPPLLGRVRALHPHSAVGQLLRFAALRVEVSGFGALAALLARARDDAPRVAALAGALAGAAAAGEAPSGGVAAWGAGQGGGASDSRAPPAVPARSPAALRHALEAGLSSPSAAHNGAFDTLCAYFDYAYGTSLGGGTFATGTTTPLGVLLSGVSGGGAGSAAPRAAELLLSAASAAPVGGAGGGRSLAHHAALAAGRLHASAGRAEEAADALLEALRVGQSTGDAPAVAYAVEALAELAGDGGDGGARLGLPARAVLLRRIYTRASELGLWRQQAGAAVALAEGALCGAAACAGGRADGAPPLTVPAWLSLEAFTSTRAGGLACGVTHSVGSGGGVAGGGGGGAGGGGGGGAGAAPAAAAAAVPAAAFPGLLIPAAAAGPCTSPPPASARVAADAAAAGAPLAPSAVSAVTGVTATALAAEARVARSGGGGARGGGGGAGAAAATAAAAAAAAAAGANTHPSAPSWTLPLPLLWHEVAAAQGKGHFARARMWGALGDAGGGGAAAVGAALLRAAALRCGRVATTFSACREGEGVAAGVARAFETE
jgi:hypothetical protein